MSLTCSMAEAARMLLEIGNWINSGITNPIEIQLHIDKIDFGLLEQLRHRAGGLRFHYKFEVMIVIAHLDAEFFTHLTGNDSGNRRCADSPRYCVGSLEEWVPLCISVRVLPHAQPLPRGRLVRPAIEYVPPGSSCRSDRESDAPAQADLPK